MRIARLDPEQSDQVEGLTSKIICLFMGSTKTIAFNAIIRVAVAMVQEDHHVPSSVAARRVACYILDWAEVVQKEEEGRR